MTVRSELKKKVKQLEFLAKAAHSMNATLDFDQLIDVIMRIVKRALNVETVSLSLLDDDGKNLSFKLARGRKGRAVAGLKIPVGESLMGWVARYKKPLLLADARNDRRYSPEIERKLGLKMKSVAAIPLMRRGRLIGVLEAVNRRGREPLGQSDMDLLVALGEHIALAVANARLYKSAERVGLEYALLAQVSADIGKSLTLDEVLLRLLKNLKRLIPFDAAAVFVLDRQQKSITSRLHQGYPQGADEQLNVKMHEGLVGRAADRKSGFFVDDVRQSKRYVNARRRTRSEMVTPLLSRGEVIGLFNLESNRLAAYRPRDLRLVEAFAAQAAISIERAHLYEEAREKLAIQKELRVARTVQTFFSPKKSVKTGPFRIAGANYPSLEVSGDYYDFFPLRGNLLAFAIADVAGKGVPASLIMSSFRASLHTAASYLTTARQITVTANRILLETVRPQDFVTAFIGVLNSATGEVSYCNAGHNPPLLMRPDGKFRMLESGGPVLGVFPEMPLQEGRFRLQDEVLLCYTDGATEARNARDQEYGEKRLARALARVRQESPSAICRAMYAGVRDFYSGRRATVRQPDDVTFLVLKRNR